MSPSKPTPTNYQGTSVLITGASSGLGAEYAREFARRGASLTLVARSEDALTELAAELKQRHGTASDVVVMDLSAPDAAKELVHRVPHVDVLVNNAGFATSGLLSEQDEKGRARTAQEVQLNCVTLTDLTQRYLPKMLERNAGTIVNIASVAAFQPVPTMAVYSATKAYVLNFTEALSAELANSKVHALAVCPGPTATNFFTTANAAPPGGKTRTPQQVVASTMRALAQKRRTVIDGGTNAVGAFLGRHMPRSVVMNVAGRAMQ